MLLEGKPAIVYGAAGAVGGAVSRALAREGARVFLSGRTPETLETVREQIEAAGGAADVTPVDALDPAAVRAHLDRVAERAGPVRIMFSAIDWGDTQGERLVDMDASRYLVPIERATRTWFFTGGAVAAHMADNGGGAIIGITANAGRFPFPMVGGFGVACAAVEHYLRQLGAEMGPSGVRVVCVRSAGSPDAPGVREAFKIHAREAGLSLEAFERQAGEGAALRHLPSLAEVADAVALMASDHARAMTSTTANVTCGAHID
ncbi:SDR family NAD(P)-dependent oxidoreductase [Devosia nitrariae]|uniref:Short-chain dehydrogenase n=1 Tax=Devosia nitrariae TaxID=2071872 RepID=A0ABQ5W9L1_9HYPH|nr:SDR family oxidoreductase [Devosia nitrariae]GLQ56667.1 short-chain dehydrogenase [Devosia nitrariae]